MMKGFTIFTSKFTVVSVIFWGGMAFLFLRSAAQNSVPKHSNYAPPPTEEAYDDDSWCEGESVLVDGKCLEVQRLTEVCWVTVQCSSPHTVCRRPSGRLIHSLHHDLWQAYMEANQSERFVPGRCTCDDDFVLRSLPDGELVCAERTIGGPCRSNYECGKRTRFSICSNKKCTCISSGYEYDRATDQCTPTDTKISCENSSCPRPWFLGTYGEMCFYGFSASMTLILAFWLTFCFCSRPPLSATPAYEPVLFTVLPESSDHVYDEEPPSYESTVVESRSKTADASSTSP